MCTTSWIFFYLQSKDFVKYLTAFETKRDTALAAVHQFHTSTNELFQAQGSRPKFVLLSPSVEKWTFRVTHPINANTDAYARREWISTAVVNPVQERIEFDNKINKIYI